jgi:hypothetical protein
MKKTILTIVVPAVLISLVVLPFAYSAPAKIYFMWAPGAHVVFAFSTTESAPCKVGQVYTGAVVWVAVMRAATYRVFKLVLVEHLYTDSGVTHYCDHWYSTNVAAGTAYAKLGMKVYSDATDVWDGYTVTLATITTSSSSINQLSVTVKIPSFTLTASYWADTSVPIKTGTVSSPLPPSLFYGYRVYRPLADAIVQGHDVGNHGIFKYAQTEVYASSLLA